MQFAIMGIGRNVAVLNRRHNRRFGEVARASNSTTAARCPGIRRRELGSHSAVAALPWSARDVSPSSLLTSRQPNCTKHWWPLPSAAA